MDCVIEYVQELSGDVVFHVCACWRRKWEATAFSGLSQGSPQEATGLGFYSIFYDEKLSNIRKSWKENTDFPDSTKVKFWPSLLGLCKCVCMWLCVSVCEHVWVSVSVHVHGCVPVQVCVCLWTTWRCGTWRRWWPLTFPLWEAPCSLWNYSVGGYLGPLQRICSANSLSPCGSSVHWWDFFESVISLGDTNGESASSLSSCAE